VEERYANDSFTPYLSTIQSVGRVIMAADRISDREQVGSVYMDLKYFVKIYIDLKIIDRYYKML
jgi:hypothetical protein